MKSVRCKSIHVIALVFGLFACMSGVTASEAKLKTNPILQLLDEGEFCQAAPSEISPEIAQQIEALQGMIDTEQGSLLLQGKMTGFMPMDLVGFSTFGDGKGFMDRSLTGFRMQSLSFKLLDDGNYATICLGIVHTDTENSIAPGKYRVIDSENIEAAKPGDMLAVLYIIRAAPDGALQILGEGVIESGSFTLDAIAGIRDRTNTESHLDAQIELRGVMRTGNDGKHEPFTLQARTGGYAHTYRKAIPPLSSLKSNAGQDTASATIAYYDQLKTCSSHTYSYPHPMVPGFTGKHIIHGKQGDACRVSMVMPGDMTLQCAFSAETIALMTNEQAYAQARAGQIGGSSSDAVNRRIGSECQPS